MTELMDLNKETAMRLWNKTFGKSTSALDYAGREMYKSAYNDRNSEFAWNVDHIFPQSQGGKTNESNLIICHILTNDEKADKFPCFTANNQKFEILKVQNHYEIKNLSENPNQSRIDETDFLDSASGVRLFKKLKGIQNKPRFVGSVSIKLENVSNTALIDFIEKLFDSENISFDLDKNFYNKTTTILLKNYDMPLKEDINLLLDKCITLNTYLNYYFLKKELITGFEIRFRVDSFKEKTDMYLNDQKINEFILNQEPYFVNGNEFSNSLFINDLVVINSYAKDKINIDNKDYYEYDYIYTKLKENLLKEASRR